MDFWAIAATLEVARVAVKAVTDGMAEAVADGAYQALPPCYLVMVGGVPLAVTPEKSHARDIVQSIELGFSAEALEFTKAPELPAYAVGAFVEKFRRAGRLVELPKKPVKAGKRR